MGSSHVKTLVRDKKKNYLFTVRIKNREALAVSQFRVNNLQSVRPSMAEGSLEGHTHTQLTN